MHFPEISSFPSLESSPPKRITAESIPRRTDVFSLGDILYLPKMVGAEPTGRAIRSAVDTSRTLKTKLIHYPKIPDGFLALHVSSLYTDFRLDTGKEPDWISSLPPLARKYLRTKFAIEELESGLATIPKVPYTGIGYMVAKGGLTEEIYHAFGIGRLGQITQLSELHDPVVTSNHSTSYANKFISNRYVHVLNAAALIDLITYNNSAPLELKNSAKIAALTHDVALPAGGDSVVMVDPEKLHEEARYPEIIANPKIQRLLYKYGVSPDVLIDAVQGRGLLGGLLDIADKISYLSLDTHEYINRYGKDGPVAYPRVRNEIFELVKNNPLICGLWDSVRLQNDNIIFDDKNKLMQFLRLRALLTRELYLHPGTRFMENLTGKVLVPYLYRRGNLSAEKLLRMVDMQLDQHLGNSFGRKPILDFARVESLKNISEAEKREIELAQGGVRVTIIDHLTRSPKPATHYLVKHRAEYTPLAKAHPKFDQELRKIMTPEHPVRLYYLTPDAPTTPELIAAAAEYHELRLR